MVIQPMKSFDSYFYKYIWMEPVYDAVDKSMASVPEMVSEPGFRLDVSPCCFIGPLLMGPKFRRLLGGAKPFVQLGSCQQSSGLSGCSQIKHVRYPPAGFVG